VKGFLHQPASDAWRRPKRRRGASVQAYICECASSRAMREEGVCAQTLRRTDRQAGRQTDTEYPGCGQCAEDKKFNTISCTKRNWKHPIYTVSIYHISLPLPLPPIDSAAVTRVHIPMKELRPCAPRSQLRCWATVAWGADALGIGSWSSIKCVFGSGTASQKGWK